MIFNIRKVAENENKNEIELIQICHIPKRTPNQLMAVLSQKLFLAPAIWRRRRRGRRRSEFAMGFQSPVTKLRRESNWGKKWRTFLTPSFGRWQQSPETRRQSLESLHRHHRAPPWWSVSTASAGRCCCWRPWQQRRRRGREFCSSHRLKSKRFLHLCRNVFRTSAQRLSRYPAPVA